MNTIIDKDPNCFPITVQQFVNRFVPHNYTVNLFVAERGFLLDDPSSLNTQISTPPKTCEECDFYKKYLAGGKTYIGDSPCQWCQNYPYKITWDCTTSAIKTK